LDVSLYAESDSFASMGIESQHIIAFWPPKWGQVERFQKLYSSTYQFDRRATIALSGVSQHFTKAKHLKDVAHMLLPSLELDNDELKKKGHTSAINGRRLTAVIESTVTALYSSIDCARKVLKAAFPKYNGLPDSTRSTFHNAWKGKLDARIPEKIRTAFEQATWFDEFRALRDALTHWDTGFCHLSRDTRLLVYIHDSLRGFWKNGVIEDIMEYVDNLLDRVNKFLGQIFAQLNSGLADKEVWQICGVFNGRIYSRFVKPPEAIDFSSGRCDALTWFEKDGNPRCPFADKCEPYRRAKQLNPSDEDRSDDRE
jgi:hypothetical protein